MIAARGARAHQLRKQFGAERTYPAATPYSDGINNYAAKCFIGAALSYVDPIFTIHLGRFFVNSMSTRLDLPLAVF